MSGLDPAKQRDEAKAWLAKADEDLAAIRACLDAERPLLGIAAYHCQQAAEKLIKSRGSWCWRRPRSARRTIWTS